MPFTFSGNSQSLKHTMQLTFSDRFQTVFRPFSEHQFPRKWSENGLNVSDRFKTERKSAINMYPQPEPKCSLPVHCMLHICCVTTISRWVEHGANFKRIFAYLNIANSILFGEKGETSNLDFLFSWARPDPRWGRAKM